MKISIDFETRGRVNLKDTGVHRYAEDKDTNVICMAWAVDDEPVKLWLPPWLKPWFKENHGLLVNQAEVAVGSGDALADNVAMPFNLLLLNAADPYKEFFGGKYGGLPEPFGDADEMHAWNVAFERGLWAGPLERYGLPECPPIEMWQDPMVRAAQAGLPQALGLCATALGLSEDKKKHQRGRYLIQRLSKPKRNGEWDTRPELMAEFFGYCTQDVETERTIAAGLPPMPYREKLIWCLTNKINEEGVPVDVHAARGAVKYVDKATIKLNAQASKIAGGYFDTLTQRDKVLSWVWSRGVTEMGNLQKATVDSALALGELPEDVHQVLSIRGAVSLASVKKFTAILTRLCQDRRVRDTLRYYGAATGRWSSVGLQVQNLKRPSITSDRVAELLYWLATKNTMPGYSYERGMDLLSECIRGAIQAEKDHVLVASDYSQIELRVLLWLAEDEENLQEIRDGLDPYKVMAALVFKNTYDNVTKDERQAGKAAVLGCGYQLGARTFREYAAGYGVFFSEVEAEAVVASYRSKYFKVKSFWYELQQAVVAAIKNPGLVFRCRRVQVRVYKSKKWLEIILPSARPIRYFRPRIVMAPKPWAPKDPEWIEQIQYEGTDTKTRRWGKTSTYGGKLVENITQGFSRDIMAAGMLRADKAGLNPIMTVHDEVVAHVHKEAFTDPLEVLNECLLKVPTWARGVPLNVEGWVAERYKK